MAEAFAQTLDYIIYGIIAIIVVGLLAFITILIINQRKYKHRYLRIKLTSGQQIGQLEKAKEYKDQDGTEYWYLQQSRTRITKPPAESIMPLDKGKFFCRAFDLGNGSFKYTSEELTGPVLNKIREYEQQYNQEIQKGFFKSLYNELLGMRRLKFMQLVTYKPTPLLVYPQDKYSIEFSKELAKDVIHSDERANVWYQMQRAFNRKVKGWSQIALPAITIISLVVVIAVIFIFGGELVNGLNGVAGTNAKVAEQNAQLISQVRLLMGQISILTVDGQIGQSGGGGVNVLNNTAPN